MIRVHEYLCFRSPGFLLELFDVDVWKIRELEFRSGRSIRDGDAGWDAKVQ